MNLTLLIGQKTAATIRQSIGDLEKEGKGAVVYGRDIVVGLPVEREIPTDLINSCLEEHFNTIIDSVKVILERTPPELGADIFKHGVYLTGGASQTSHFAELLQKSTGIKVNQAQRPLESVVLGMGRILKEDNYKSVAYAVEGWVNESCSQKETKKNHDYKPTAFACADCSLRFSADFYL